ncbi:MAG: anaerobic ribonucleoside-triphosphate reductase activating protein [Tissierellia bacterium]|nr:anaerobic ribonucleoside-triphosphate reductase activating protein [Tissierellia bacterium]
MRYAQIRKYDVANGPGIRTTIFVTGCTHNCKNCFNKEYQDFNYGELWTDEQTELVLKYLKEDMVSGLTLLGGEPFQNCEGLIPVLKRVRTENGKNIWAYSGYKFEQLLKSEEKREMLSLCDVLVDGLYIDELKNLMLKFRGSSNQRIIDVKKSLSKGKIIEIKI